MSWEKPQVLMGDNSSDEEWILPASKKWIPPVNKPKRWGTNLPQPRKQWQNHNNGKGGKQNGK